MPVPDGTTVLIAPLAGVGRDYPLSIEKLAPILSWYVVKDWRRRVRALHPDPAIRRHGAHDVDPLEERGRHPAVRAEEAGVPNLREHADDARLDRADDRARSGDDARVRRLGRQHHVRQHLAAASAQYQAAGVRGSPRAGSRAMAPPRKRQSARRRGRTGRQRRTSRLPQRSARGRQPTASPPQTLATRDRRVSRLPRLHGALTPSARMDADAAPEPPAAPTRDGDSTAGSVRL